MDATEHALSFYRENYNLLAGWQLKPGPRIFLGEREARVCRFCRKTQPDVSFRLDAHAIPEQMGNKTLFSLYECDSCNKFFGSSIENDFGNWSKPMRTLQRVRGKKGVPKLTSKDGGWRIECDKDRQFNINHSRGDPVFTVHAAEKRVSFLLKRAPYTPIAVLKAFVKIGLSLMPEDEMPNFTEALQWVCNPKHSLEIELLAPVNYAFVPGPVSLDRISAAILRRQTPDKSLPYAFLLISAGNENFQVMLPCPRRDPSPGGEPRSIPAFPHPRTPHGPATQYALDLSGLELEVDDKFSIGMTFEEVTASSLPSGFAPPA